MKKRILYQIDSFTKEKFKGNPAGLVLNAEGMDDALMQSIARELNNSETAFLFPPDGRDCDGIIRYFTPQTEVPVCGHATIAAMYAKAVEEGLGASLLRYKTRIGVLPLEIVREHGDYEVVMTQGRFELGPALDASVTKKLIAELGLLESDLDERCPIQIASTGHSKVMIGIRRREKLNRLAPHDQELAELSRRIGCNGYYVFTLDSNDPEILIHGRMFAPAIGIHEDPVTGNANGPLGGYLVKNKIIDGPARFFEFKGRQGEAMRRPGVVRVKVTIENGEPVLIRIQGEAVIVFRTEIVL